VRTPRLRIGALVALAVVVVVLSATQVIGEARRSMVAEVQASERLVASERAQALSDSLRAARQRIAVSASYDVLRLGIQYDELGLLRDALDQAGRSPGITGGAIVGPDGRVMVQSGSAVDRTPTTALRFRSGTGHRTGTVTIGAPVRDEHGAVVAWLQQAFDIAGLVPQFAKPIPYTEGAASLIHRSGEVLLTTTGTSTGRVATPKLRALLAEGRVQSGTYHSQLLDADRVAAVAPVRGTDLMVLASADRAAAADPASKLVWRLTGILLVSVLAVAVLATLAGFLLHRTRRAILAEQQAAQVLARTDPLTLLGNRRAFDAAAADAVGRPGSTAVVAVDLDHLKELNDNHGHGAGDAGLRLTAEALLGAVRPGDVVCRTGGDEFAVLLPDTDLVHAGEVAARIEAAVGASVVDGFGPLSASTGVATGPNDGLLDTARRADVKLYEAKQQRRAERAGEP
jgi:diguanylate cyclase (GGDEF)-like protein